MTANALLCGAASDTNTAMAEELIRELLSGGEEIPSEEVFSKAKERGISERTVNAAKKNIPGIQSVRRGNTWCWRMDD